MIHGTPAIIYDTLRYSWAWKHVGIVDYIQRHGSVESDVETLSAYHDWPGFFTLSALVTDVAGVRAATAFAAGAPVLFNLAFVGGLFLIFRSLTRDRRLLWLAIWLFVLADWVGQDYFAPQAMAYFLYLVVIGICVGWLRGRSTMRSRTQSAPRRLRGQVNRSSTARCVPARCWPSPWC